MSPPSQVGAVPGCDHGTESPSLPPCFLPSLGSAPGLWWALEEESWESGVRVWVSLMALCLAVPPPAKKILLFVCPGVEK